MAIAYFCFYPAYAIFRLSKQAETFINKSPNYENIASGAPRSTKLIQSYRNLYSEGRVQAFDAIDEIFNNGDIRDSERVNDVKTKLLFSVIVVRKQIFSCGTVLFCGDTRFFYKSYEIILRHILT